jgi:putative membrane protein
MRRWTLFAIAIALICAAPVAVAAQQQQQQQQRQQRGEAKSGEGKLASGDQKFMMKTAQHGKAEVELGKLASEKASSPAVKQFGEQMATDHGKANDELMQLAQQKGVTLPTEPDSAHKNARDRLSKLEGEAFDREYVQQMVREHDNDVREFDKQSKNAKDPDVKAWAGKTLPVLKEHQLKARELAASMKNAGSGSASPRPR